LWNKSKIIGVIFFILIFLPFSSIYYSTAFEGITKSSNIYLIENPNVIELGGWLDKNTPKDSTLLVPPDWMEIKIWSKRSVVGLWYDIAWCAYSKKVSVLCQEIGNDITSVYNQTSTPQFLAMAKKYNAQYIVTYNKSLSLPEISNISEFKVYKVLS
jgi:hypothetical protein